MHKIFASSLKVVLIAALIFGPEIGGATANGEQSRILDLEGAVEVRTGTIKRERILCAQSTKFVITTGSIPGNASFLLFEAHSQWYNLTVSMQSKVVYGTYENGTDIGIILRSMTIPGVYVSCQNRNVVNYVDVLVKTTLYMNEDPIPGGCNSEFPLEEDPNIHNILGSFTTRVAFQYANIGSTHLLPVANCEKSSNYNLLHYDLYEYVIGDLSEDSFMQALGKILNGTGSSSGKELGHKISSYSFGSGHTTESFVSYTRQASMFIVMVTQSSSDGVEVGRAMYVPAVSYGCQQGTKCTTSAVEWAAKVLLLVVGVAGLFIAFLGHRFFQTEMFFFGYLAFKIILLLLVLKVSSLSLSACAVLALCCGLVGGLLWWAFWYFKGIPICAVLMPGFSMGFVLASLLFNFTPFGQLSIMQTSLNYGLAFTSAILLPSVILLYFTKILNLAACSLVGSFMPLFAASLFFSGNFANMVLDSFKALRDPAYLSALRNSTPNINDIILCVIWALLSFGSFVFQYLRERKRPPFPPCPYQRYKTQRMTDKLTASTSSDNVLVNGEREPLIQPSVSRERNNSYGGTGLSVINQDQEIVDPI